MTNVGKAFRDADGPMAAALVRCLDFMNGLPAFRAYKAHTWGSLEIGEGRKFLDVACGVGFDVGEMAKAFPASQFVGLDKSRAFLDLARARCAGLSNATFVEGEADRLPFPDDAFDGVRIDRSLQHVAHPASVVAEMVRVTRPGGRVVAAEPDWGAFFLYNGESAVTDRMVAKWLQSIAHPHIGREIGLLFSQCGVGSIGCTAHSLSTTALDVADVVFDLRRLLADCVAARVLTNEEADRWRAASERATADGSFLAFLAIVERAGTVKSL